MNRLVEALPEVILADEKDGKKREKEKLSDYSFEELQLIEQKQNFCKEMLALVRTNLIYETEILQKVKENYHLLPKKKMLNPAYIPEKILSIEHFIINSAQNSIELPNIAGWGLPFNVLEAVEKWYKTPNFLTHLEDIKTSIKNDNNFLTIRPNKSVTYQNDKSVLSPDGKQLDENFVKNIYEIISTLIESVKFLNHKGNKNLLPARDHIIVRRLDAYLNHFLNRSTDHPRNIEILDKTAACFTTSSANFYRTSGFVLSFPDRINVHKDAIEHLSDMFDNSILNPIFIASTLVIPEMCGLSVKNNDYLLACVWNNVASLNELKTFLKDGYDFKVKFAEMVFFEFTLVTLSNQECLANEVTRGAYTINQIKYAVKMFLAYKNTVLLLLSAYCDPVSWEKAKNSIEKEWSLFFKPLEQIEELRLSFYQSMLEDQNTAHLVIKDFFEWNILNKLEKKIQKILGHF